MFKKYLVLGLFLVISVCFYFFFVIKPGEENYIVNKNEQIIIEYQALPDHNQTIELHSAPADYVDIYPNWSLAKNQVSNEKFRWVLYSKKPLLIRSNIFEYQIFVKPGDSISISQNKTGRSYSGKGIDALYLEDEILMQLKKTQKPTKNHHRINSLEEYLNWKSYLDNQLQSVAEIIDSYKDKVPSNLFNQIKFKTVYEIEFQRAENFWALYNYYVRNKTLDSSKARLSNICDSILNSSWAKWLGSQFNYNGNIWYFIQYNRMQVWRRFEFDATNDTFNTTSKRSVIYYNNIKSNYQGLLRERLLQYFVSNEAIKELGFNDSVTAVILQDYYSQPGFPEYKKWVREYEENMRKRRAVAKR